ncbi:MAG: hypothetical protein GXO69_04020 [Acidobacteria bacterium]|nr:hypothetical protein [Acidobacteriota bacterium]
MNRIRKIQFFLLLAMLFLIAVVILNFDRGKQKIVTEKTAEKEINKARNLEAGSTKMESGVHVLYRNGVPFATVHFKEAVQKKNQLHLTSPVVKMSGSPEKLISDSADLKNDIIVLNGKISLLSPENRISVSLTPPAIFKNGILTGGNSFSLKLNGGVFSGTNYTLKVHEGRLLGKENVKFINDKKNFCIRSMRGVADLKAKTLAFVRDVRITEENGSGNVTLSDAAYWDTPSRCMFLSGKGKLQLSSGAAIFFAEAVLRKNGNKWDGNFPSPLNLKENGRILYLPNAVLRGGDLHFPWSILRSGNILMTSAQGNFNLQNSAYNAKSPVFRKKNLNASGRILLGKISDGKAEIQWPFLSNPGIGWIYGRKGEITSLRRFFINGNITGRIHSRIFTADRAKTSKGTIVLENSTIWDEDTRSFSCANRFVIRGKQFSADGNYRMKQLQGHGTAPLKLSASTATGAVNSPIHLQGKVHAEIDKLSISASESYVYEWGAVFFHSVFSGKQIKQGKADFLIILKKDHSARMLGNAEVTDLKGNRIQGHKLTLSTITGRISVYSGKKKVRIKLAL